MEFMGKKLEDIVVTLPYADGTCVDCGVFSYFEDDLQYAIAAQYFSKEILKQS